MSSNGNPPPDPGRSFLNGVGSGAGGCLGIILVLLVLLVVLVIIAHAH